MNTFYALSTVWGKSGVSVIRISGPKSSAVLKDLGYQLSPHHRMITRVDLRAPDGGILDQAMFVYFQAPNSFTGEDVLELHLHGSLSVIKDTLKALSLLPYLRLAQPGEFSRHAFLNGKMDLTQAEGLVELIEAETTVQRQVALRQMGGEVATLYNEWRERIVGLLANVEALIDFPEGDVPESTVRLSQFKLEKLQHEIAGHLQQGNNIESLHQGIQVVIAGNPNVGKSSLMNWLSQREVAIVSDIAGTTRDVIQVKLDLSGFPLILMDTAGLREHSVDVIEQEGIRRAHSALVRADITLAILSCDCDPLQFAQAQPQLFSENTIIVLNKVDLLTTSARTELYHKLSDATAGRSEIVMFSTIYKLGGDELLHTLTELVKQRYTPSQEPLLTKQRHRQSLQLCLNHLSNIDLFSKWLDLSAEELRRAAMEIGYITGRVPLDEILNHIFSNFCIGK